MKASTRWGEGLNFNKSKIVSKQALERFGEKHQIQIAIEECSELIQVLCHFQRKRKTKDQVTQEIADVYLSLESLKHIFGTLPVDQHFESKLERLQREVFNE